MAACEPGGGSGSSGGVGDHGNLHFYDGATLLDGTVVGKGEEIAIGEEYIVRGKRINHYVDEFEIVWFDGKEIKNPAYVLWVAAHAAEDEDKQIATLCSWSPPEGDMDNGTRIRLPISLDLGVAVD